MTVSRRSPVRYRISPNVIYHWHSGQFLAVNYATRLRIVCDPLVATIVTNLGGWKTAAQIGADIGASLTPELQHLVDHLVEATIVRSTAAQISKRERLMEQWASWNPAVGLFHSMSTGVTFVENDPPRQGRARSRPVLGSKVTQPGKVLRLRRPGPNSSFDKTVLARRTWRRFAKEDVTRPVVEHLLWMTAGVQGWLHTPRGEHLPLTTSPSGGARHPIEIYVFAKHVDNLPAGLYHYDGVRHTLRTIGAPPARTRDYLPRQYWYENAALILFLAARFDRTRDRYPFPRAYRAVLLEAGHVAQTFCLTATSLGLAPFCTMALDDDRIERDLGLDGIESSVLYAAGVGVRPRGGEPSAPIGEDDIRVEPRKAR